jgi:hypothetical protein
MPTLKSRARTILTNPRLFRRSHRPAPDSWGPSFPLIPTPKAGGVIRIPGSNLGENPCSAVLRLQQLDDERGFPLSISVSSENRRDAGHEVEETAAALHSVGELREVFDGDARVREIFPQIIFVSSDSQN